MTTPDLSALVSARLCHDLISPMGAIGNGLELLQMAPGAGGAELDLISDSLDTALARLRFYRIAFGPSDPAASLSLEEATEITDAMYAARLTIAWDSDVKSMPRPRARLITLAILCLEKSLPMGGQVRVELSKDTVSLSVSERRVAAPEDLWSHVTTGTPLGDMRPDSVQFALLRQALAESHHAIAVQFDGDNATLNLTALSPQPA